MARELGVNEGTLGNWCAKARGAAGKGNGELSESERAELVRLRKENIELRMQRDVLKRSVALWVERGDGPVAVAGFIAAQRAEHQVPAATACRALAVSPAWFYKWRHGDPSPRHARREQLKTAIRRLFAKHRGTYGSPRITADLRDEGWRVSENTVAAVMAELGLAARRKRRRKSTTRQGRGRWRAPDLIGRDFGAATLNHKWYGDGTEIPTDEGKLYLDSVLDMGSRRIVGFALGEHHDADLATCALQMAVAVRGGKQAITGVIFHTDQGSEFTAGDFRAACGRCQSPSPWAGSARRWTTRSSRAGTPPSSSSCAIWSTSPPRPRPGAGSPPGSRSTTTTGATPHAQCSARSGRA